MRLSLVLGTRPQIIKSAPIVDEAAKRPDIELEIVHTGQHYDYEMSRSFFNELSLPDPIVNLGVGSGTQGRQTAEMLLGLEKVFTERRPDAVVVPGDTNSALAGALAAVKLNIPVAHVEAGARSFDIRMPEEVNRRLTDHCSTRLFAVTERAVAQLAQEGIPHEWVTLSGDTMYESLLCHEVDIEREDATERYGLERKGYSVLTLHRAENTDDEARLIRILDALVRLEVPIVFPCHPRTRARLAQIGRLKDAEESMAVLDPAPYFTMLSLVRDAAVVLTDSGGLQKEAFWLGTPCVTLRDNTEWTETIEAGANRLAGSDPQRITRAVEEALIKGFPKTTGDAGGLLIQDASKRIIDTLLQEM